MFNLAAHHDFSIPIAGVEDCRGILNICKGNTIVHFTLKPSALYFAVYNAAYGNRDKCSMGFVILKRRLPVGK